MTSILALALLAAPEAQAGATLSYDGQPLVEFATAELVGDVYVLGDAELVGELPSGKSVSGACALVPDEVAELVGDGAVDFFAPDDDTEIVFTGRGRSCEDLGGIALGSVQIDTSGLWTLSVDGRDEDPPKFVDGQTIYVETKGLQAGGGLAISEVVTT